MKKNIKYLLPVLIFCFFACEREEEEQYKLYIINNSNETIISVYYRYLPNGFCIKVDPWESPIIGIAPKTTSYEKGKGGLIAGRPHDTTYVYLYNKIDVDTMSCDEFNQKHPVKKLFAVTKADMEKMNWTLVYP